MNAPLRIMVLSLSALGLSACASSQESSAYAEPARVANPGDVSFEQDASYITIVERAARDRGVVVQWVHPPTKRAKSE